MLKNISIFSLFLLLMTSTFGAMLPPVENLVETNKKTSGHYVSFHVENGKKGSGYVFKTRNTSTNWLFIYPNRMGVTKDVRKEGLKIFNDLKNVNVFIIDLNDGFLPKNQKEAVRLLFEIDNTRLLSIIDGAIIYAGSNARIGSLGWCNGGAWALQSAIHSKNKAIACVIYYGMPEFNKSKLNTLNTDVLALYGTKDTYITPHWTSIFKKQMHSVGKNLITKEFDNPGSFACKDSKNYNELTAEKAYTEVLNYLRTRFM